MFGINKEQDWQMQWSFRKIVVCSTVTFIGISSFAAAAIADFVTQPPSDHRNGKQAVAIVKSGFKQIYSQKDIGQIRDEENYRTAPEPVNQKPQMPEFPHYLMGGGNWGQELYRYSDGSGGSAMVSSGCGPAALSMVLAGYGVKASPMDVANWLADHGGHSHEGTAGSSLIRAAKAFGVPMAKVNYGKAEVIEALKNGKAIIAGHGGEFANPLFAARGGSGHFVVYTGISNDGKTVYVNDPNDYDNVKHVYDVDTVLSERPDIYVVL